MSFVNEPLKEMFVCECATCAKMRQKRDSCGTNELKRCNAANMNCKRQTCVLNTK